MHFWEILLLLLSHKKSSVIVSINNLWLMKKMWHDVKYDNEIVLKHWRILSLFPEKPDEDFRRGEMTEPSTSKSVAKMLTSERFCSVTAELAVHCKCNVIHMCWLSDFHFIVILGTSKAICFYIFLILYCLVTVPFKHSRIWGDFTS